MIEHIYICIQSGIVESRREDSNKSSLLVSVHKHSSSFICTITRFVLRSHGIDGDTVVPHSLHEPHEILSIIGIISLIEMSTHIIVIRNRAVLVAHLHPSWRSPRRSYNLQFWVYRHNLPQNGYHIVCFFTLKSKMFYSFCVTKSVARP